MPGCLFCDGKHYARKLCHFHYHKRYQRVLSGNTTWAELVAKGQAGPAEKKFGFKTATFYQQMKKGKK